jgi:hypothetical protein
MWVPREAPACEEETRKILMAPATIFSVRRRGERYVRPHSFGRWLVWKWPLVSTNSAVTNRYRLEKP